MKIFKYPLRGSGSISMPRGAKILTVQVQGENPCVWALVDPDMDEVSYIFSVVGTGLEFDSINKEYVGTFQELSGVLIWHVFVTYTDRG